MALCDSEDIVYIADVDFGLFYYSVKYFVFDVGYVKFGYRGSKWKTHLFVCMFFLKGRRKELVLCRHGEVF